MSSPASDSLQILMFAIGTAGDVFPSMAIGRALRQRGHRVVFITNSYFEDSARRAGLEFQSTGTAEEYLKAINDPELWQFGKGFRVLIRQILDQMRPTYAMIAERCREGETIVVAPAASFGARLAQEKLAVPLVHLHLQPIVLRTRHDQPGVSVPGFLKPVLPVLRNAWLSVLDRRILDPALLPELNSFRGELGLAAIRRPFDGWIHSPQRVIGLFPEWFAPRQPDWPAQLQLTGFTLYDEADARPAPEGLEEFLNDGAPPLVFARGSGMRFGKEYFAASAEACGQLGRRGILIAPFREQIPDNLPPGVRHFAYVPFSSLLPRSAVFVHHGGVGSMAQGFRAGIPQLVTPFNFDQPDNAVRLKRLGAGDVIRPRDFQASAVTRKLAEMLASEGMRVRCREIAGRFAGTDPVGDTCGLIEAVAQKRTVTTGGR